MGRGDQSADGLLYGDAAPPRHSDPAPQMNWEVAIAPDADPDLQENESFAELSTAIERARAEFEDWASAITSSDEDTQDVPLGMLDLAGACQECVRWLDDLQGDKQALRQFIESGGLVSAGTGYTVQIKKLARPQST